MTAILEKLSRNRLVRWLIDAKRLPLYFAVMVITAIMYHYWAALTPVWLLLSLLAEIALFRLFRFVEKHHVLGGFCFCMAGLLTLFLALVLMYIGETPTFANGLFVPDNDMNNIDFYLWFMTPQSVLDAVYIPYTAAIFLLFSFFIGFVTYYFTMVQYRVLMSFSILCFPFAIYAKEDETMPVLCIILLFAVYFAVMIFCRQLHAEDPEIVHEYEPENLTCTPEAITPKTLIVKPRSEIGDSAGWRTGSIFLCGACIVALLLPKPTVQENRTYIEGLINMAAFTDALLEALGGFDDTSDGGTAVMLGSGSQLLYYCRADKDANLRRATFTDYHYDTDSWSASTFDEAADEDIDAHEYETALYPIYSAADLAEIAVVSGLNAAETASLNAGAKQLMEETKFTSIADRVTPYDLYLMMREVCEKSPELTEEFGLSGLTETTVDPTPYVHRISLSALTYNANIYLAPNQTFWVNARYPVHQNRSGILYRTTPTRIYHESFTMRYLSDDIAKEPAMQMMMAQSVNLSDWLNMLARIGEAELPLSPTAQSTLDNASFDALTGSLLRSTVELNSSYSDDRIKTPQRVKDLAMELTEGLNTDYEKASAICNYLAHGDYVYDLDYVKADDANVDTFLFESKTGVCYQFASAMVELCRAAGLSARYVEGYSMSERAENNYDYIIRTTHGHAFADVFIAGYGWMSFDATAPDFNTKLPINTASVISTLQIAGLILLIAAVLLLVILKLIVPYVQEKSFRRWYESRQDGEAVQKAFARLRTEWDADPAVTARVLCEEKSEELNCDTAPMLSSLEQAVYGGGCSKESASAAFRCYQVLREAWKKRKK